MRREIDERRCRPHGATAPRIARIVALATIVALESFLVADAFAVDASGAAAATRPTVGVSARIDQLVLPGSELEPVPLDDRAVPIVLRIAAVHPHGTAFRYDFVFYGLEPGEFDLKDFLRRKDGSSTADLPAIPVAIASALPAGQIEPHAPVARPTAFGGGYRALLIAGGVLWIVVLALLLFARRSQRKPVEIKAARPRSLAERLRPAVEDALAGRLDPARLAELERMLLAWWRRRLRLDDVPAAEALARLRGHDEAGALLRQLEEWLHAPPRAREIDVAALLAPYRSVSMEDWDEAPTPFDGSHVDGSQSRGLAQVSDHGSH
ncbi:MAG: hypothetical protein WD066_19295 [Planctomycetaceae bacterium]